ncbi:MAG: ketopantoate reductase C-terminal domain-containing protein [Pseudomonadota bacterium]|nr:ketopantoate reductase C-terminal domain-containing protein [Pseudomonadota bacterium]
MDFRNCQPTEIASLNGAVVALGARHWVPTPRNETLLALVRAREAQYLKP